MKSRKVKLNIGDCLHDLIIGGVFFFKEDTKLTIKEKTKFYLEFMQIKNFCSLNTN